MDYLLELKLKPYHHAKYFPGQVMTPSVVINSHVAGVSEGKGELCLRLTGVCGTHDLDTSHN